MVSLSEKALAARGTPYLDELNPAQREAVEQLDGPVLMLAGAGTGKTKALTTRIVHLLNTGRAQPKEILAVTFTNKAAREMRERVGRLLGQPAEGMPWLGTFHSICVKLLRRHAELVGLKSNFTILDTDDQLRLLRQILDAEKVDRKRYTERFILGVIDRHKNRAETAERVGRDGGMRFERISGSAADGTGYQRSLGAIYAQYQQRLRELNATDFGDLLLHMVTIFQQHDDVLAQYQRWFKYVLVDEYQDTNVAQYLWLRLLAGGHKNICCVGDDDQSIYGWRGAEVGNILRFEKDFPGAKVIRLEQNYRSTPHILAAAGGVIAGNESRLGKELWTEAEDGEKVRLIGHWDGEEEARWIGDEIEAMQRGTRGMRKIGLDDMAILVRASHQMRAFEDRFLTIGLPYRVIGGPRFYERMEIRDAMAYFRLVVSPEDDLAFERVVNTPKRGLGDKAQQKIQVEARSNMLPLYEGAQMLLDAKGLGGKGAVELQRFLDIIRYFGFLNRNFGEEEEIKRRQSERAVIELELPDFEQALIVKRQEFQASFPPPKKGEDQELTKDRDRHAREIERLEAEIAWKQTRCRTLEAELEILKGNHMLLAEMILDESGYTEMWQNDKTPEAPGRLENLKELVKALEQFENLQGFLEHVSLIMDNDSEEAEEKVSIMTLHAAKGLEFPAVFLPGWEDGLFPSQRSMDESGIKGLEEERRLAYVGITRAEELCTISFAGNRRVYGQWQSQMPSRFIDELPEEHVDVLTPPGLYGGGYGAAASTQGFGQSNIETAAAEANVYNSPGWRRLQARSSQRPVSQPQESRNIVIDAEAVSSFTEGDRVFHAKFGYGEVMEIEGDKLTVEFDKAGSKKLVAKFVMPADQAGDVPF